MVARRSAAAPTQTVVIAGVPVVTTVTVRPGVVRRWVYTTRWRLRGRQNPTVGLGVQWTPRFRAGANEPPGTLQLCAGNRCLVFQIAKAGGRVPMILRRFMADRRVTFAGRNVEADCRKLQAHHGLVVASPRQELRRGSGMGGNASMEAMAERHLGIRGLTKSTKAGLSKWDGPRLSKKQVRYACVDAYLSRCLGVRLRSRNDAGRRNGGDQALEVNGVREVYCGQEVFMIGVHRDHYEDYDSEEDYEEKIVAPEYVPPEDNYVDRFSKDPCDVDRPSTFAMAPENPDRYDEEDSVGEDYDSDDYDDIAGPEYDPLLHGDVNRMVGAIFCWDDCNDACFPEDPVESVFPSTVGVLA